MRFRPNMAQPRTLSAKFHFSCTSLSGLGTQLLGYVCLLKKAICNRCEPKLLTSHIGESGFSSIRVVHHLDVFLSPLGSVVTPEEPTGKNLRDEDKTWKIH